jgi:uncharacterized RDD family membrane protein YckC
MARVPVLYKGHESARMLELEGTPLASFLARFCAFYIDMAIAALSYMAVAVPVVIFAIKKGWLHDNYRITFDPFHHEAWPTFLWFVIFIGASNYIGNGATIGKKIMRIRAVSLVHKRLSLWHSIERALGYGASALEAFFGFFQFFIDPSRQTVHDRIAKTIVVSERRRPEPATVQADAPAPAGRAAELSAPSAESQPPDLPASKPAPPAS